MLWGLGPGSALSSNVKQTHAFFSSFDFINHGSHFHTFRMGARSTWLPEGRSNVTWSTCICKTDGILLCTDMLMRKELWLYTKFKFNPAFTKFNFTEFLHILQNIKRNIWYKYGISSQYWVVEKEWFSDSFVDHLNFCSQAKIVFPICRVWCKPDHRTQLCICELDSLHCNTCI